MSMNAKRYDLTFPDGPFHTLLFGDIFGDNGLRIAGRVGVTACLMNFERDVMMHDVACAGTNAATVTSVDVLSTQATQNGMQAVTAKVQPPFWHAL
jgi:hypothetical protein